MAASQRVKLRCIHARAYFTERFFGNDMDFGHKTFWHYLNKQRDELEHLLEMVERRAYELLLASQNAMWVLEQHHLPDGEGEDCAGRDEEPLAKSRIVTPSRLNDTEDVEDPVDVALREKRQELWEKIWTRLARYCSPYQSRFYKERVAVIWACVCRAIYTDPTLMLVAQNYRYVTSMLSDAKMDLPMVEKLWKAIKVLYVFDVRAAVDDVLHPMRETGEYVVVFGTRVHKELSGASLSFHGWGHMTAVFPCYSCVRRVCKTVDDIVALTRYAILSGQGLAQSQIRYEFNFDGCRVLSLCGFIPNVIENVVPRYQVEKCNCFFEGNKPHWTETKANNAICVGLSLNDPKTQLFVNACLREPDFMVLCRKGPTGRLIRSKPLWGTEVRKADTRAGLKKAVWDQREAIHFQDSVLDEARPLTAPDKYLDDCFQVAIVDGGEGDMQATINKLVKVWYRIYEVEDFGGLLLKIGNPYLTSEELEVDEKRNRKGSPLTPNLELDVLASYRRLWGHGPREGRLVDDEIDIEIVVPPRY
ncbi:hypothetical protein NLJ89_g5641 [Agrocybe chaxingu]|uniref:Uncharacterized protein n=1 Tax=Agrocybe chaxingu TaxID=84603 RepID=A0A9W8MUU0_9AGAR|nr:hypothetical protein NLJ89_g5641 [Agrocybe chaxingu]